MVSTRGQTGSLTPTQLRVVATRGNLLVMAGAGTGKTKTLIERCLDCLARDGADMEELLVVTFTEAAAAEMRERLRQAMEERLQEPARPPGTGGQPGSDKSSFWSEQLARFDLAHIGTLHGFCLKLIREHFCELGLDPRLAVLGESEGCQLADETLEEQFAAHFACEDEFSLAVQNLIQIHGFGRVDAIRDLVMQLHHYAQARPDAAGWLAQQRQKFSAPASVDWALWLPEAIKEWRDEWLPLLEELKGENPKAAELVPLLSGLDAPGGDDAGRRAAAEILEQLIATDASWPSGRKLAFRKPLEAIFAEAPFLLSLAVVKAGVDPLVEDWSWVRGHMETLLLLAGEFAAKLAERKRTLGLLDFHDLEQFALKLLWDSSTLRPTAVAAAWRAKLKFVFVDEYQDINAAQDRIIQGLSREGAEANRFLVGDVKQSIYRFRLADPKIFRDYARQWRQHAGKTIPLSENFRSREGLLELVNSLFRVIMHPAIGGLAYDDDAELRFGARQTRSEQSVDGEPAPCAELLLRFQRGRHEAREEESGLADSPDEAQREARLVARRLQELMNARHPVYDADRNRFRAVAWRDMAILLRAPLGISEVFAREFARADIPLKVARGGFFDSAEILDLLSLLELLDNPLQDVPCLAVLRSPIAAFSLAELAEIRLTARDKHFWTALNAWAAGGMRRPETAVKVSRFLERFARWRKQVNLVSLSHLLEAVLAESLYLDWLRGQPGGPQRAANVSGLLHLAQRFDQFQRQGLYRFLRHIEAQREVAAEPGAPADSTEDAVRLMSIHLSKGLEFPVVVLADLTRQFNERDLRGEIIFDEKYGLCPKVQPPQVGRRYPSLPHWLAQRRQKRELRGEELRLLYVALTRARDYLILAASITEKSWDEKWQQPHAVNVQSIAAARCYADWLALWFSRQSPPPPGGPGHALELNWLGRWFPNGGSEPSQLPGTGRGQFKELRWWIVYDDETKGPSGDTAFASTINDPTSAIGQDSEPEPARLHSRLEWGYPFIAATRRKAKSSVTALRREAEELADESEKLYAAANALAPPLHRMACDSSLSASEIGAAHHKFLQHLALEQTKDLAAEAERLVRQHYLSRAEQAALNLTALASFWHSSIGRNILAQRENVRRELPFTARFSPQELARIIGAGTGAGLEAEYVIVQGVADLIVLRPDEIWLVDFKTDQVPESELAEKIRIYSPQLQLYALALEKIFTRRVTLLALHFLAAGRTEKIFRPDHSF